MTKPTITARTLGAMPALVEQERGEDVLHRVFSDAGLPLHLIDDRDYYIPQAALKSFVAGASHALGSQDIGLLAAPHLSVRDYGTWGDYVLGGPTLKDGMDRALKSVHLHASGDWLAAVPRKSDMLFAYRFAEAGGPGYEDIAFVAAAVMLSLPRYYLGQHWVPDWLALDIGPRRDRWRIEQTFGCDVHLGRGCVAFPIPQDLFSKARLHVSPDVTTTIGDVLRERVRQPPRTLADVVREQIRMRLGDGQPGLEEVARALNIGPRSLQRHLAKQGISFRDLATSVKIDRARELLALPEMTVTRVANELSFSTPANFARAFAAQSGTSPSEYRARKSLVSSGNDEEIASTSNASYVSAV